MTVFKNYLKVAKNYLPTILIYTCIFIGIALITTQSRVQENGVFQASQASISVINRDEDSPFVETFEKYVQDHADYVHLKDDEQELRDALFFRKVDYIMIIPKGFSDAFMNGEIKHIETMEVPDAYYSVYSKNLMNKYLNTASLYLKSGLDIHEISQNILEDLNVHTDISFENKEHNSSLENVAALFNFSNYTLISIIIVVVSMIMIAFQEEKVNRRHLIAPISSQKFHFQLVLGNVVVSLGIWLVYVVCSIVMCGDIMFTKNGILFMINSLALVVFVLVLSVFLTTLTHNRELVSGISTVVGLGTSFIAGAFVPQELLSPYVLNIAKATPSYWFIKNNQLISSLTSFTFENLKPFFTNIGIIFIFIIIIFILNQYVCHRRMGNL